MYIKANCHFICSICSRALKVLRCRALAPEQIGTDSGTDQDSSALILERWIKKSSMVGFRCPRPRSWE